MLRLDRDLKTDPELEKKLNEAMTEAAKSETCKNENDLIIWAARHLGYEISAGELERLKAVREEMDPEEMKLVSGAEEDCWRLWETGYEDEYGHGDWCVTAWHCEMVTLHTSMKSKYVACWSNFRCSSSEVCWSYFYGGHR